MTIKQASPEQAAEIAKLVLLAIGDIAYQLTGATSEQQALMLLESFIGRKAIDSAAPVFSYTK